ncbi:MAG: OmpA family protein [Candidatus Cloacimonetes bacterium]|nr:OmpA family protein [Candidatus Cloacimonadota bacterium]
MRARTAKEDISVWTSFTDAVLCFLLIVLMVFIANIIHLQKTLEEKEALAAFAEAALNDKRELVSLLDGYKDLKQMITVVNKDTIITFSEKLTWQEDNQFNIEELDASARKTIELFGNVVKEKFLDHRDKRDTLLLRHDTYSILIIGHANKIPAGKNKVFSDQFNYNLSKKRADAVREFLFEKVFEDKEKYKIYSSGVGVNHLIYNHDKKNGDRCIEIAFKYDALDMIKGNK